MKLQSRRMNVGLALLLAGASAALGGCGEHATTTDNAQSGSVDIALLQGGVTLTSVSYTISGPNGFSTSGTINVASSSTISAIIGGLPAGSGFTITLGATGRARRPAAAARPST